jgi:hypothetical protein
MQSVTHSPAGHSSRVEAFLEFGGQRCRVERVGGKRLILRDPCEISSGAEAILEIRVDDWSQQWTIVLTDSQPCDGLQCVNYS